MVASSSFVDSTTVGRRNDLPALTGLRFVAALLVFLPHTLAPFMSFSMEARPPAPPFKDAELAARMSEYITGASMAMPFFFMLSGFVLTWSASTDHKVTAFWRRRIVRIFPNHIVTWVLAMVLFAGVYTPASGLTHLFLVNTWSTDLTFWLGANPQAWSLCAELLFYLLFPLLFLLVRRIPDKQLWIWAAAMVAGMYAVCLISIHLIPNKPMGMPGSMLPFWFVYFFPPVRLLESFLGMLLARIVMSGRWPRIGWTPVVALLAVAFYAMMKLPQPYNLTLVPAVPLALAIGTFAAANIRGSVTVAGSRPMVWLGNISFSFYMIQGVTLYWVRPHIMDGKGHGVVGGVLLFAGLILINTLLAWVLFRLVERPMMRRFSRSRKASAKRAAVREPVGAAAADGGGGHAVADRPGDRPKEADSA